MRALLLSIGLYMLAGIGAESVQAARLDGVYVGEADATIVGQTRTVPFSFTVKQQRLQGRILVPGVDQLVQIRGSVNQQNGRFLGTVRLQAGISGQFSGKISRKGRLRGTGTLNVPAFGAVQYRLAANAQVKKSPFQGTWLATVPPGRNQSIQRVEIGITKDGVASISFTTNAAQVLQNNQQVGDDGQLNSVIDVVTTQSESFRYFIRLQRDGTFTVEYQGGLGRGDLAGRRTSSGGVRNSLRGEYSAVRATSRDPIRRVQFVVGGDRSIEGEFTLADNSRVPFTNLVGDRNDFAGSTEGGIAYFAQIRSDGTFTLDYQLPTLQRGTLVGRVR